MDSPNHNRENSTLLGIKGEQVIRLLAGESRAWFGSLRLAPELILFALYFISFEWLKRASMLPPDSYGNSSVLLSVFSHLINRPKLGLFALVVLAAIIWKRRELWGNWSTLPQGTALRTIVLVAILALTWPLVLGPFNFYTNQLHGSDRIILLALALGATRKPIFLFPFLALCGPMVWDCGSNWTSYPWEFFGLPLRVVCLFAAWFLFASTTKISQTAPFWLLLLCLIAAHYWCPGLAKFRMGWFWENQISYFLPNSYATGWLANLDPASISDYTQRLAALNIPLVLGAVTVELGCLFLIVIRRRAIPIYLLILVSFHTGIFLMSGICLWQWAIVELTVAVVLLRKQRIKSLPIFSGWQTAFSIVLIAAAPLWHSSAKLSWFDGPVKYSYRFEAIGEDGTKGDLSPQFFAPYDRQFALNSFHYLAGEQAILFNGGRASATRMIRAGTLEGLEGLEREHGIVLHNASMIVDLEDFLIAFTRHYNQAPTRHSWIGLLSPPPGVATHSRTNNFESGQRIRQIDVYQVLTYFDGKSYREMRTTKVLEVPVPDH